MIVRIFVVLFLLSAGCDFARANLVTNGGFETGDFTGWTISGNGISIDNAFVNSGCCDASFAAASTDPDPGILSQGITTVPGIDYVLSFALMDESGLFVNQFIVTFGSVFGSVFTGDQVPFAYSTVTLKVPGADITSTSTMLSFQGLNDSAAWNLDDVSLETFAIPEPSSALLLSCAVALLLGVESRRRAR